MRKNVDPYMDEKYGIMDYLLAQKKREESVTWVFLLTAATIPWRNS